jgi:hypothetical protein
MDSESGGELEARPSLGRLDAGVVIRTGESSGRLHHLLHFAVETLRDRRVFRARDSEDIRNNGRLHRRLRGSPRCPDSKTSQKKLSSRQAKDCDSPTIQCTWHILKARFALIVIGHWGKIRIIFKRIIEFFYFVCLLQTVQLQSFLFF